MSSLFPTDNEIFSIELVTTYLKSQSFIPLETI